VAKEDPRALLSKARTYFDIEEFHSLVEQRKRERVEADAAATVDETSEQAQADAEAAAIAEVTREMSEAVAEADERLRELEQERDHLRREVNRLKEW